ncbi:saccharopine dehydrogenase NADP-binding domain-containing protein [Waterburya agarophytonicola K14]|uniref:Saccharopine dehydrogenase NADP-binding domain-containing protein n=1 Tax=Waterburya agarophytonicola KI4 TaxID=2874699 RepID=A0A964BMC2_9CYAN|nr:saccharopine dehydrogenase NADP-binding domain-containing protein [Waterburya agarophytonicola]MCC0175965.1 saccharopine dehydrogenase NADP-binding domain-containing protein [Waterburya agarophytonicola KI4]
MTKKVLVIGGCGRIGNSVAQDIASHTNAEITVTSRDRQKKIDSKFNFLSLDLANKAKIERAIAYTDLVIHCAGPFHYRDGSILETCIDAGVDYIDVSDHRSFYERVIQHHEKAIASNVTAILNTGIFPGISNSMVKQGIEEFDRPQKIHLSYIVGGSGGAGLTVMRTTFLGLRNKFSALINGKWQDILPYTEREIIEFPQPYGKTGVYWFDMPETYTFADSFAVDTVITKFGSIPDWYNHLTWITAHIFPERWVTSPKGIEFFSQVSYFMTKITDRFSGIGVAMRAEIIGEHEGKEKKYCATMTHNNTAIAAGAGTGAIAQLILDGKLKQPGIYPVEQALSTPLFIEVMKSRDIKIMTSC